MARVLIAGCGYVGSVLGSRLAGEGHIVWGLRRDPAGLPEAVTGIGCDLGAPELEARLPDDVDWVFYAVGADSFTEAAYRTAYVEGLDNLLQALRRKSVAPARVVFTSSTGVYHQQDGEWVDETSPTEPAQFSGQRVLEGERLVRESPFPSTAVRFGGIYGPRRTRLITQVRNGEAVCPEGPPRYINLIHRDDCAGVLAHLMTLDAPAECYLAVDSEPTDRGAILRWTAHRLGLPDPPASPDASSGGRRGSNKRCSNARLLASGYRFRYPTFRDGYEALIREGEA
ncbi:MAG: SDR family oxidoreductase [Candidatus Hydrogenedentota bacterium]